MKICLFSSFFKNNLPVYVETYAVEISRHFDLTIFVYACDIGSEEPCFQANNIRFLKVINEGLDFGMWLKAYKIIAHMNINTLCLANDSCILFQPLDAIINSFEKSESSLFGCTSSNQIFIHAQSYFLLLDKKGVEILSSLFLLNGILNSYDEVVNKYELGLSKAITSNGYKISSFMEIGFNRPLFEPFILAEIGCPLIKRFHINIKHKPGWLQQLENLNINYEPNALVKYCNPIFIDSIQKELI